MTPEELVAIRERANVEGTPWESFGTGVNTQWTGASDRSGPIDDRTPVVLECHPSVAEFIAHAPTDIAALLAAVERLTEERDEADRYWQRTDKWLEKAQDQLDRVKELAQTMLSENGQSWNSISGRRILEAIDGRGQ